MEALIFLIIFELIVSPVFSTPVSNSKDNGDTKVAIPHNVVDIATYDDDLQALIEDAIDWAHNVGFISRTSEHRERSDVAEFTSFALFPSPFPRKYFEQAVDVQKAMQLLRFRIACDHQFLVDVHRHVVQSDEFIRKEIELIRDLQKEGIKQPLTLIIQRSDYMLNVIKEEGKKDPTYAIKQIEVNIGALGGADKSRRITELHRRTLSKSGIHASSEILPENFADTAIAEGLYLAWQKFGDPNALIVFMVYGPKNKFQFGQRYIEYELERLVEGKVKIVRLTLGQCIENLKLADDFSLRLNGQVVGVLYNRVMPSFFWRGKKSWEAYRNIERSTAIKASTIFAELTSTKKVQQVLALPGMVERFFPDPKEAPMVAAIRETFAGLWGMENDDPATETVVQEAIAHPERYVMKPQRDGGGHCFFDEELTEKLRSFSPEERAAHILMERLHPMVVQNYMIRPFKEPQFGDVVNELGVFGVLLGNMHDGSVLHNKQQGAYVRTKLEVANEGGLSAAGGVIDSPYLY